MITNSFDNKTKTMISLEDFYGEKKNLLDICLIIFSKNIYENILATYECDLIAEIKACNGIYPIYRFNYQGLDIAFYLTPIGSMSASQFCIECNWLTGADKFIMFGSAGSLDKDKTQGKFVIPTESYRDEGMSYHYAPASDYIVIKNHHFVKEVFDEIKVPYIEGRIWTTDAFLRETINQVKQRKDEGCIAVEMEVAGVQAVCDFHGFNLFNFLATGDVLTLDNYKISDLADANHNMDKFYIALEIAKRIK